MNAKNNPHVLEVAGSSFYHSELGKINARIVTGPTIDLNDLLLTEFGRGSSALIMGCAEGSMATHFSTQFKTLTILEGSSELCESLSNEFPKLHVVNTYFEDYVIDEKKKMDWVLANHVLEHVANPIDVLKQSRTWLSVNGRILVTVPNATSLHRKIGVKMGVLETAYSLSDNDHIVGHQRIYDIALLTNHIEQAGFKIIKKGGYNLKMVSQKQMAGFSEELLKAIFEVSLECPAEICSNIYVVAQV